MKIEAVALDDLLFDVSNARKHSKRNLEAIASSLSEFGQRKPIVVDSENIIIAGNGTAEAAKFLGWKQITVARIPEDWDDNKIRAYALADNRTAELAAWDADILNEQLLELQEFDLDMTIFGFDPLVAPNFEPVDEVPRLDEKDPKFCPSCGHDITNY
jgi:ParB-like chromosome segregation protein Spo0J